MCQLKNFIVLCLITASLLELRKIYEKNIMRSRAALNMVWLDIVDQIRFINDVPLQNLLMYFLTT